MTKPVERTGHTAPKRPIPGLIPFNVPAAVIDIETTGLNARQGHRIVDIAFVVIMGPRAGESWQQYVNPERDVPDEAARIHGLDNTFLAGKPTFDTIAPKCLAFLDSLGENAVLIAHNGIGFDFPFLNHEFQRVGQPLLDRDRCFDSLELARHLYPYQGNSLDALCRRLQFDLGKRSRHGALLDCQLLAQVYLSMARSAKMPIEQRTLPTRNRDDTSSSKSSVGVSRATPRRRATDAEKNQHSQLMDTFKSSSVIWKSSST